MQHYADKLFDFVQNLRKFNLELEEDLIKPVYYMARLVIPRNKIKEIFQGKRVSINEYGLSVNQTAFIKHYKAFLTYIKSQQLLGVYDIVEPVFDMAELVLPQAVLDQISRAHT